MKRKKNNNEWITWSIALIWFFIFLLIILIDVDLERMNNRIRDLPHKVCINETIWTEYNETNFINEGYIKYDLCLMKDNNTKYKCFIETKEQICKWEGLE